MLTYVVQRINRCSVYPDLEVEMGTGADAGHSGISDHVYKFTPMEMTAEERGTVHGANESVKIRNLLKTVQFYSILLEEL